MGTRSSGRNIRNCLLRCGNDGANPTRTGFAILVCPRKLEELHIYSTLLQPSYISLISSFSVRCNRITREAFVSCPTFREVADRILDILHDGTEALQQALSDAFGSHVDAHLMEGIDDLGGAELHLDGGTYNINHSLRLPNISGGNFLIHGGSLRA